MTNIINTDTLSEADDETSESDFSYEGHLKLELLEKYGIDVDEIKQAGEEEWEK